MSHNGNGSLIQTTPGEEVANGAKRYSYNTAGFLVKVETYSDEWQPQAEMAYDGLGRAALPERSEGSNRLAMTGYADGQSVTTIYALDGRQTLLASAGELTTTYLYGLGVIGEQTDTWAYPLLDGANTARQMVNAEGKVTLTTSYTPWGDTLGTWNRKLQLWLLRRYHGHCHRIAVRGQRAVLRSSHRALPDPRCKDRSDQPLRAVEERPDWGDDCPIGAVGVGLQQQEEARQVGSVGYSAGIVRGRRDEPVGVYN